MKLRLSRFKWLLQEIRPYKYRIRICILSFCLQIWFFFHSIEEYGSLKTTCSQERTLLLSPEGCWSVAGRFLKTYTVWPLQLQELFSCGWPWGLNLFSLRMMASNSFSVSYTRIFCSHHKPWMTWFRSSLHSGFLISTQSVILSLAHAFTHSFVQLYWVYLRCQTLSKELRIHWWWSHRLFFCSLWFSSVFRDSSR